MNKLGLLFHSEVRAEVLRILFGVREDRMYRAEIIAQTKFAKRSVEEELEKLGHLELVVSSRDGNRCYYTANKAHPLYPELRNIVLKTVGLREVLQAALLSDKIEFAFVFGSLAQLTERAESDVDLMIIGRIGQRELAPRLRGLTERVGREINPHIFTWGEFARRVASRDHFLSDVLAKPKLFIIGKESEFADLARQRVAAPASD
jgi:predicted nucleotidyltransferase